MLMPQDSHNRVKKVGVEELGGRLTLSPQIASSANGAVQPTATMLCIFQDVNQLTAARFCGEDWTGAMQFSCTSIKSFSGAASLVMTGTAAPSAGPCCPVHKVKHEHETGTCSNMM